MLLMLDADLAIAQAAAQAQGEQCLMKQCWFQ
jgi:hypothetical protein